MNFDKLIQEFDPVTLIEFKNYIAEHLSKICSTKNSNSKIVSNFKSHDALCQKCGCKLYKNGKTKNGIQKYRQYPKIKVTI